MRFIQSWINYPTRQYGINTAAMTNHFNTHILSYRSVRLYELSEGEGSVELGHSSGFFCSYQGRYFLVTNWHVVSGRHFQTKQRLHNDAISPGFLKFNFYSITETRNSSIEWTEHTTTMSLYQEQFNEDSRVWLEHPKFGSDVDVAAIDITELVGNTKRKHVSCYVLEDEISKDYKLNIMDDVFIAGYPLRSSVSPNEFPIFKGGTIASEPRVTDTLPLFLIDTKTKKGMSGSPVIVRQSTEMMENNNPGTVTISNGALNLIGVYSGRERAEKEIHEAELGIVWNLKDGLMPIITQQ